MFSRRYMVSLIAAAALVLMIGRADASPVTLSYSGDAISIAAATNVTISEDEYLAKLKH